MINEPKRETNKMWPGATRNQEWSKEERSRPEQNSRSDIQLFLSDGLIRFATRFLPKIFKGNKSVAQK